LTRNLDSRIRGNDTGKGNLEAKNIYKEKRKDKKREGETL
jgi:hypothetical protein